jgi:hypothetical protein
VFVDLTAAYDTVWNDALMLKLCSLLDNMEEKHYFPDFLGDKNSR